MNSFVKTFIVTVVTFLSVDAAFAQTTLPAGSDVAGDFSVGSTAFRGNLSITGQIGNSATPGIKLTGDGGVLFLGDLGVGQIPTTGGGARFMWYPGKGALRAGVLSENYISAWNDSVIGIGSVAFSDSKALGNCSTAMGVSNANASFSTAMSRGVAYGEAATALSGSYSNGYYSTAMSTGFTMGAYSTALSGGSALAELSIAAGSGTYAESYSSFVIGRNNATYGENPTTWVSTDCVFVIGNGTGDPDDPLGYHDAFVVRKNGAVEITGTVKMPRQGDILMGEFGNPE